MLFSLPTYRLASIRSLSLCTFVLTPCQEFGIDCGLLFGTWDELNANAFVKIMLGCFFTPLLQSCLNAAVLARMWVGADRSPPQVIIAGGIPQAFVEPSRCLNASNCSPMCRQHDLVVPDMEVFFFLPTYRLASIAHRHLLPWTLSWLCGISDNISRRILASTVNQTHSPLEHGWGVEPEPGRFGRLDLGVGPGWGLVG